MSVSRLADDLDIGASLSRRARDDLRDEVGCFATACFRTQMPAQAKIRSKAFPMPMNKEALSPTDLLFSTRSMALAWMLDVPAAGER